MNLGHLQARIIQWPFVEFRDHRLDAVHHLDHVDAGIADDVDDEGFPAVGPDLGFGFHQVEFDLGNVADGHPGNAAGLRVEPGAQDQIVDPLQRVEFVVRAHHVAALAFLDVARGNGRIGAAERVGGLGDRQTVPGHPLRIDNQPELVAAAAPDVDDPDTVDPLEPILDHVFHQTAEFVNLARAVGFRGDREPGDRVVFGVARADARRPGIVGDAPDVVETVADQHQRPVHVGADPEGQNDSVAAVPRRALDRFEPFDALERVFLAVGQLFFHLEARRPRPGREDRQDRFAGIRRELDRNGGERDKSRKHNHQNNGNYRRRTLYG